MGIKYTSHPLTRAVVVALCGLAPLVGTQAATPVPTLQVGPAASQAGWVLDATVQAVRQATVAAQVGGNVQSLLVKAGDRVQAGQALARLDDREAAAGLNRSDAAVQQANAELRNARQHAERTRELRAKGFVSQAAQELADTQLQATQAQVQQAQAARSQAALARGFAVVTAPFDGVVQATHLDAGDLATPGRPILTLYAPGALRAVVQVPASKAQAARQASGRQVRLPDGRWVQPVKTAELPATDPVAQTVEWRLDLPAGVAAQPGQSVSVRFDGSAAPATEAQTLTLPASAVLHRGELEAVYLVQEGRFVLRAVRLGARRGSDSLEVLAGLKAGDVVARDAVRAGLSDAQPSPAR